LWAELVFCFWGLLSDSAFGPPAVNWSGPAVGDEIISSHFWGFLLTSGGVDGILCRDNRIER
jgi:hypothetical protein